MDDGQSAEKIIRLQDRAEIAELEFRLKQREKQKLPSDQLLRKLESALERAQKRSLSEAAENVKINFPPELPVSGKADEIAEAIKKNPVVIVCGSTGSGKTTQLPKIALKAGYGRAGMIGCTQPRRIAASSMAERVAEETECRYGVEVGCQVRFDSNVSDSTVIKFMTDGILLAETCTDRDMLAYEVLIIDEAHERSLNIDFILGYLKGLLARRKDLRIVISSATLDAGSFSAFFDNAPVIEVEGRTFPVEDIFLPPEEDEELPYHIMRAVNALNEIDPDGDVLVFLPGEREIRDCTDVLEGQRWRNTDVLPLFARMGLAEQRKIFHPASNRRIILATNVAETSITIPRIHYVIDSGMVRLSRFNPRNQVQELQIEQVSQASARQRRGRCGRICDGICVYLYDQETMEKADKFTDPEIRRSSLAGVILRMGMLRLPPIENFPLPDPPQVALIRDGYQTLFNIGAIDENHRITRRGREIAAFPIDPHLAAMTVRAYDEKVLGEILVITSYLSIMDPRERPAERQQAADQAHRQWHDKRSDFIGILNLWNFLHKDLAKSSSQSRFRRFCQANFLNYRRVREWFNLFQDLFETVKDFEWNIKLPKDQVFEDVNYDKVHFAIMAGIPTHLARYDREEKYYRGTKDRKFYIFPASALHKATPEWILSFELVHTSRLFARQAAEIKPEWLEYVAPHLCKKVYDNIQWNAERGFVSAREMVVSGGLLIHPGRTVHYGRISPEEARKIFIRDGLVPGNMDAGSQWLVKHKKMLDDVTECEIRLRRPDALFDFDAVEDHFLKIIPPEVCSVKTMNEWIEKSKSDPSIPFKEAMTEEGASVDWDYDFPDWLEFLGCPFEIKYNYDPGEASDGAVLLCPEDQLNMMPDWIVDWTVPGWLPEKVRLLLKSLPKDIRGRMTQLNEKADAFCRDLKDGKVFCEKPLLECLSDYFSNLMDEDIEPSDFSTDKMPGYLTYKIGVVRKDGSLKSLTVGSMPDRSAGGSKLSRRFKAADEWIVSGVSDWPGDCPEKIEIDRQSGTFASVALTDESKSVGRHVFLDPREAALSHRNGLVRLYRLLDNDHIKFCGRNINLSKDTHMFLSVQDKESGFSQDIVSTSIYKSLTASGVVDIRTEEVFRKRFDEGRHNLYAELQETIKTIESAVAERNRIAALIKGKSGNSAMEDSIDDIESELEFYFRPGFIRYPLMLGNYPRYLRALRLRTERMIGDPAKDRLKMKQVDYFDERFALSISSVADFGRSFALQEFAMALQEWRIAVFAPEVGTSMKISETRLQSLWDNLKL